MKEYVKFDGEILAIIVRSSFRREGIEFFTPEHFSQQLGYMKRPKGYTVEPHIHNFIPREVSFTQEVLFIKSGKVRIDFYDGNKEYFESKILESGDIILLAHSGHGLMMLEESELIEVKQGPYIEAEDKIKFESVPHDEVIIK